MEKAKATILCDLGYGDAGKGSMTDYFCRSEGYTWVVRYTGGPQASHYVALPDGRTHCFSQFGSGTLSGVKTLFSRTAFIEPAGILAEEKVLADKFAMVDASNHWFVDEETVLVTPWHRMIGRLNEIVRGAHRHGSCGQGVGEAAEDSNSGTSIKVKDLADKAALEIKVRGIADMKFGMAMVLIGEAEDRDVRSRLEETFRYFRDTYPAAKVAQRSHDFFKRIKTNVCRQEDVLSAASELGENLFFEGAQGVLLDPVCGFPPFVTKTRATGINAEKMLAEMDGRFEVKKIGALRAYAHRHGAGPLVTEDATVNEKFSDANNVYNEWQGNFRVGWLDLVAMRYAIAANGGVDELALTCLDQLAGLPQIKVCRGYIFHGDLRRLEALSEFCDWQRRGTNEALISALIASSKPVPRQMAELLFDCQPEYAEPLLGWDNDLRGVRAYGELPVNARNFIDMIEYELKTPVEIVSVNPTYHGKLLRT